MTISEISGSKRAVILVSGGLDSTTVLAMAKSQGYDCYTLTFDYGQRHRAELLAAERVSDTLGDVEHKVVHLNLDSIGGSALTDASIDVPEEETEGIPVTYVPARNTVFLSIALGWAEVLGAHDIFIGVNAMDYSGYPDCRPAFLESFEQMANLATKVGVSGERSFAIHAPLLKLTKKEIIEKGMSLGVNYNNTHSCYDPDGQGRSCRRCDSCRLRLKGFAEAGLADPIEYQVT